MKNEAVEALLGNSIPNFFFAFNLNQNNIFSSSFYFFWKIHQIKFYNVWAEERGRERGPASYAIRGKMPKLRKHIVANKFRLQFTISSCPPRHIRAKAILKYNIAKNIFKIR